jgi:hypothetical protein
MSFHSGRTCTIQYILQPELLSTEAELLSLEVLILIHILIPTEPTWLLENFSMF